MKAAIEESEPPKKLSFGNSLKSFWSSSRGSSGRQPQEKSKERLSFHSTKSTWILSSSMENVSQTFNFIQFEEKKAATK